MDRLDIMQILYDIAVRWSYLGAFIISIIGNAAPFISVPYLMVVFLMASNLNVDPFLLGIASGIGGGVGKLITYLISKHASQLFYKGGSEQLEALKKLIGNYGALATFIFAATPSPDDVVIIVLGMINYDIKKFFISVTAGKIVISLLTAYAGKAYSFLMEYLGLKQDFFGSIYGTIAAIILLIIITAIIVKVDWVEVMKEVEEKGWRGYLSDSLKKFFKRK